MLLLGALPFTMDGWVWREFNGGMQIMQEVQLQIFFTSGVGKPPCLDVPDTVRSMGRASSFQPFLFIRVCGWNRWRPKCIIVVGLIIWDRSSGQRENVAHQEGGEQCRALCARCLEMRTCSAGMQSAFFLPGCIFYINTR